MDTFGFDRGPLCCFNQRGKWEDEMNSIEIRYAAFELTVYATLSTLLTEMALSKDDEGQRWLETFRNSLTSQITSFSSLKGAGEHAQEIARIASGSAKQIVNGATQGFERRTAQ